MNSSDYAIVVGISHYPALGPGGTALDLAGPGNDATAVAAWLASPAGGGLPDDNIRLIRSREMTSAGFPQPALGDLNDALTWLLGLAQANLAAGEGEQVGRRLYVYMSGHGFSPAPQQGCLFTAEATQLMGHNVHASGWLAWLRDAGYFHELVLWLDCCMDRISLLRPGDPPLPTRAAPSPPGPGFVAFAARRPLRAVQTKVVRDGQPIVLGAFTSALLDGLDGAAADIHGRITGRSLADWLRNAQPGRLSPGDRADPAVSQEPDIIKEDPDLIFRRGVMAAFPVTLHFPPVAAGGQARLWGGTPPASLETLSLDGTPVSVTLQPGLYLVDVPVAGLRQGFEVIAAMHVAITETGPAVAAPVPLALFELGLRHEDAGGEIFVIDGRFGLVDRGVGRLRTRLPFGLFKIKTRLGGMLQDSVLLLDRDLDQDDAAPITQPIAVAAALPHSTLASAPQVAAMRALRTETGSGDAAVTVMTRLAEMPPDHQSMPDDSWNAVSVRDRSRRIILKPGLADTAAGSPPYAAGRRDIKPGLYFLQIQLDGAKIEQSLIVPAGWLLEVQILRRLSATGRGLEPRPRVSLILRRLNAVADDVMDRQREIARIALADERSILRDGFKDLVLGPDVDPLTRLIGGHLLLIAWQRDRSVNLTPLNDVVRRLNTELGPDHPDVAALSLHCPATGLRSTVLVSMPPMFARSWALLAAGGGRPAMVAPALRRRVRACTELAPYFAWTASDRLRGQIGARHRTPAA